MDSGQRVLKCEILTKIFEVVPSPLGSGGGKMSAEAATESGPLRAVHLSRHKWPGGLVNRR